MINAAKMKPFEKIDFIRDQIAAIRTGHGSHILCPYCGVENLPSNKLLCCDLFNEATMAVLDRMEKEDALRFLEAVQDNASRRVN